MSEGGCRDLEFLGWCGSRAGLTRPEVTQGHSETQSGTDVRDSTIDQYWPKHKEPGQSRKQLWEYSEKRRCGVKATGEVPYRLSRGHTPQDRT